MILAWQSIFILSGHKQCLVVESFGSKRDSYWRYIVLYDPSYCSDCTFICFWLLVNQYNWLFSILEIKISLNEVGVSFGTLIDLIINKDRHLITYIYSVLGFFLYPNGRRLAPCFRIWNNWLIQHTFPWPRFTAC